MTDNATAISFLMNHKEINDIQRNNSVTILSKNNKRFFKIYDDRICLMITGAHGEAPQQLLPLFAELLTTIANDHDKAHEVVSFSAQTSELRDNLENMLCDKGHIVELNNVENDLQPTQSKIKELQVNDFDAPHSRPPPPRPISPK